MSSNLVIEAIRDTMADTTISQERKLALLKEAQAELDERIDTLSGDVVE